MTKPRLPEFLGEAWTDLDLVIDRGDGEPFPPDSLSRDWYRLVHRIGLPDLRLHDLRHAFATRLLEGSVHPKVVSEPSVTPRSRWTPTGT